jgi:thiamine biosynthesis lipoprotein
MTATRTASRSVPRPPVAGLPAAAIPPAATFPPAAVLPPAVQLPVSASARMLGGTVLVALLDDADPALLRAAAARLLRRLEAWAARLTRHAATSELIRLNVSPLARVPVRPTLTAVLDWARDAESRTDGLVDVALLEARIEAETGLPADGPLPASRRWSIERGPRWSWVRRDPALGFDLDGVAKGWLADRALDLAPGRSALVDGDGDVALRVAPGDAWTIGIGDPRDAATHLGMVELVADGDGPRRFGISTSGTTVHRWVHRDHVAHHLIDPWTGRPAATDIVQATALAATAREAEAYAKSAVLLGTARAFSALDRPGVFGLLVVTDRGEVRATQRMQRWLA